MDTANTSSIPALTHTHTHTHTYIYIYIYIDETESFHIALIPLEKV